MYACVSIENSFQNVMGKKSKSFKLEFDQTEGIQSMNLP